MTSNECLSAKHHDQLTYIFHWAWSLDSLKMKLKIGNIIIHMPCLFSLDHNIFTDAEMLHWIWLRWKGLKIGNK